MPFKKMDKIVFFFPEKKIKKLICEPTQPKIFRPGTRNTLIFYLALFFGFCLDVRYCALYGSYTNDLRVNILTLKSFV